MLLAGRVYAIKLSVVSNLVQRTKRAMLLFHFVQFLFMQIMVSRRDCLIATLT